MRGVRHFAGEPSQVIEIARLLGGVIPVQLRGSGQPRFQLFLPMTQRPFIGFNLGEEPTDLSLHLSYRAALPVKFDRSIGHVVLRQAMRWRRDPELPANR